MDRNEMREIIQRMTPFDDPLFNRIFKDNIPGITLLLKACLGKKISKVIKVDTQVKEEGICFHSVVYDVLAEDEEGRLFNIEMQKKSKGAGIKRARFNASTLDLQSLLAGEDYSEMRDTYVIFITLKDIWKCGSDIVRFGTYSEELKRFVDDGRHIYYVNGAATGNSFLASVMHDLRCSDVKDMKYNEIAERTRALKNIEEEVEMIAMTYDESLKLERKQGLEQGIEQGIEQGKAQKTIDIAKKMKAASFPLDDISQITGLSKEEIVKL